MGDGELLLIIGPPAVGKMTVGRAVCARTDFRLFHNHYTVEPLLEVFGFGTEPFNTLNSEFRRRLIAPYVDAGLPVSFVELYAGLETRLVRNVHEERIDHKRSNLLAGFAHLRLDNSDLTPERAAAEIVDWVDARSTAQPGN